MNKKILSIVLSIIGLVAIFFWVTKTEARKRPVTVTVNASLREMSIDDKIEEAELIVIGEVKTVLPSKWKSPHQQIPKNLTPQQMLESDLSIFTDTLISIDQILKGRIEEPVVRVRSFVGEIDQVRFVSSSEPNYEKGKVYLLFLHRDTGPTQIVDPGDYISVNAVDGVYQIVDGKAISSDDEWDLNDLVSYIEKSPLSMPVTSIPDTLEAKEIMKTIERAYDIEAEAAHDFNTKNFPAVFINDPRYEIDPNKLDFVRNFLNDPSLETAGYLDYQVAYYNWWHDNTLLFEAVEEKAKSENREVTQDEIKSIIDSEWAKKWGLAPARGKSPVRENTLRFTSVDIDGGIASVYLHDGSAVVTLYLVQVDKKWYIAAKKGI